jgi:hypothetical protein
MADVDRIVPPVPTLPPPIGRGVGSKQRRAPRDRRPPADRSDAPPQTDRKPDTDHIDEYV